MRFPWQASRPPLAERVARAFERGGVLLDELTISADRGRVTLRGPVPTPAVRDRAVALAQSVAGVRAVDDRLVVVQSVEIRPAAATKAEHDTIYIVQPSDTLERIAERVLGTRSRWPELLRLNERVVGHTDILQPGQRLRLPRR
ncbi:MAG: BON domain-containing protein [Gemmatimonadota bacterium]|nr:BON domain-containing protein [Gemmatimonadota bacterium]